MFCKKRVSFWADPLGPWAQAQGPSTAYSKYSQRHSKISNHIPNYQKSSTNLWKLQTFLSKKRTKNPSQNHPLWHGKHLGTTGKIRSVLSQLLRQASATGTWRPGRMDQHGHYIIYWKIDISNDNCWKKYVLDHLLKLYYMTISGKLILLKSCHCHI